MEYGRNFLEDSNRETAYEAASAPDEPLLEGDANPGLSQQIAARLLASAEAIPLDTSDEESTPSENGKEFAVPGAASPKDEAPPPSQPGDSGNDGNEPPHPEIPGGNDEGEPHAARFNQLFAIVEAFNKRQYNAPPTEHIQIAIEFKAMQELIDAGIDADEALDNVAAIEGGERVARKNRDNLELFLFELQHQNELHCLGLTLSPDAPSSALPIIGDGETFARVASQIDPDNLDKTSRKGLERVLEVSANNITHWKLIEHRRDLIARYESAMDEERVESLLLWHRGSLDMAQGRLIEEILMHVDAYGPALERLGIGQQSLPVLSAMQAAERDGMAGEAALLHELGAIYTDEVGFMSGDVASWTSSDAGAWRLLDEIVDHITLPGQPLEFRRHMAELIPATLERLRVGYAETTIEPAIEEFDLPAQIIGPNKQEAGFFAQKRDEYRRRLAL